MEFINVYPSNTNTSINQGLYFAYNQPVTMIELGTNHVIEISVYNSTQTTRNETYSCRVLYRNNPYS